MPRPKKTAPSPELRRLDFRIPEELLRQLTALAAAHERSVNGELLWMLREYLKRETGENDHAQV